MEHIDFCNVGWMLNFEYQISTSSKFSCQKKTKVCMYT